jgi:hypothetical protein
VYVSEVTSPAYRTTFGAGISGFYNLGVLTVYVMGAFFHWRHLGGIQLIYLKIFIKQLLPYVYTCDFPYKSPYDSVYDLLPKVSRK